MWELSSFSEAAKAVVLLADILRQNHRLREQARSHRRLAVCLYFELGADSDAEGRLALQHRISHIGLWQCTENNL